MQAVHVGDVLLGEVGVWTGDKPLGLGSRVDERGQPVEVAGEVQGVDLGRQGVDPGGKGGAVGRQGVDVGGHDADDFVHGADIRERVADGTDLVVLLLERAFQELINLDGLVYGSVGVPQEGVYTIDDAAVVLAHLAYVPALIVDADDGAVDVAVHVVDAVEEQLELRFDTVGPAVELIPHADGGLDVLSHIVGDAKVPAGFSDGVGVSLSRMRASWLVS